MDNLRAAIGRWMTGWHAQLQAYTPQMQEFARRDTAQSIVLVPGRMIDAAQDMLNLWVRNDTHGSATKSHKLPVVMLAMAPDMSPTGREWGRFMADEAFVSIEGDPKERVFKLRTQWRDARCQVVFAAHEPDTAQQLAAAFALWMEGYSNKRFDCIWPFSGQFVPYPVQLESDDVMAARIPVDAKNLTMLALDFTLKVQQPFFRAPGANEANDGKGSGALNDLSGYPLVANVRMVQSIPNPNGSGEQRATGHEVDEGGVHQESECSQ